MEALGDALTLFPLASRGRCFCYSWLEIIYTIISFFNKWLFHIDLSF